MSATTPIFLFLAPHGRAGRVLHLEPVERTAGAIRRALALRHDAFQPKLARMPEYGLAVFLDVVIEPDAMTCLCHDIRQGGLTDFERIAAEIALGHFFCAEADLRHAGEPIQPPFIDDSS
jgi:hypothetical protein